MFSENLKKLRTNKGLSQEQLSEIIDVSRQSISKYESGVAQPSFDKLIAIAKYFDVSIDFLLLSENNNNSATVKSNKITITSHLDSLKHLLQSLHTTLLPLARLLKVMQMDLRQLSGEHMIPDFLATSDKC